MLVSDFDYDLPEERIAKFPPKERGASRLLKLDKKTGEVFDSFYRNLDEFLDPGDLLVLNDTKVMRARIFGRLPDGRSRELVLLESHNDSVVEEEKSSEDKLERVLYRGKLHPGDEISIINSAPEKLKNDETEVVGEAVVENILGNGIAEVVCSPSLSEIDKKYGTVPLPPYLKRDATVEDIERYQTVWADKIGSAAAPTASLNMTNDLLDRIKKKDVGVQYLTLHVGLGTFLPIRTDEVEKHEMHSEWFEIPEETIIAINKTKKSGKRVFAVGTTVTRTLEFYAKTGKTSGEDNIFIYPGFEFKMVDGLVTNFHAPRSTVLMLAAAFAGWENLKNAYEHAIFEKYNFLSFGDSMLIC